MLERFVYLSAIAVFGLVMKNGFADPAKDNPASGRLINAAAEPQNWLTTGGTYSEERYSPLNQINADNIGRLKLAWYADLDTGRGQEATPLIVDGVMYTTTAWSKVYAFDAVTGKQLWYYDPKVPGKFGFAACCDVVNRGAAYEDGRIFFGALDGRLIALDAKTGKEIWSAVTVNQSLPFTITGAPRVFHGKVVIGNGGAEYGVRGYVSAYDAKTGHLDWRFYTVPGDPAIKDHAASDAAMKTVAAKTWYGNRYWKEGGGGGTVWDAIAYDPGLNQLYIGTGNGTAWNRQFRSEDKGDNLFLSSIVALNADTGRYIWHYQTTPGDVWDYDAGQQFIQATLPIDGIPRKVLMQANKNGFFYVLDRVTGKLISADKFSDVNWATKVDMTTGRPVENPGARFKTKPFLSNSGASGAHNWQPMAYSPQTGLVYIPVQQIPFLYVDEPDYKYKPGLWNLGIDMMNTPLPKTPAEIEGMRKALKGWLLAWDPVKRKATWQVPHDGTWHSGVLATAGDLVFQGLADRTFRAYRATDGKELWSFPAQTALLPGPVSYSVNGVQYISIMAGNGGGFRLALPAFGTPQPSPKGRVLTFRLDGTATLPPFHPQIDPPNPPKETASAAAIQEGSHFYAQICAGCHGMGTHSAGIVPDLRRSAALTDAALWQQIVIGGALEDHGMVSFANYVDKDQAEAIRAYIGDQARALGTAPQSN